MNPVLINQAHRVLNACGFVHSDRGGTYVPIEKRFLLPMVLQPNQTVVFQKEIVGETVFGLRAISCDQGLAFVTGVRIQIQFPNGRYLFGGNGIDVGQFAWVGSYRFPLDPEIECEPGSKISVSLTDTNIGGLANPLAVNLVFEGPFKFYLAGGAGADPLPQLASKLPRYQGIVNENIIAPSWRAGVGPSTPKGFRDDVFTYSSPVQSIGIAGPVTASTEINIDNGLDLIATRVLVDLTPDPTVSAGSILGRLRTGDGYALMDDYIDIAKYIAGAEWPVYWKIRSGDQVLCELALVDAVGTGNMRVQVHLEGMKRSRQ